MRLFAAVWPPDEVLDHLDLALGALRRGFPGDGTGLVRWSARETWHLTCAFYGEVPDGQVHELGDELVTVAAAAAPYRLALRGAGVFAHRTLWVGVRGQVAAQQAMSRAAGAAGSAVGRPPDARPRERAHLTIGRVRPGGARPRGGRGRGERPRGNRGADRGASARAAPAPPGRAPRANTPFDPESVVAALAVYEGPEWTVDALCLVASRPGAGRGGGPAYEIVEMLPIGPAGRGGGSV